MSKIGFCLPCRHFFRVSVKPYRNSAVNIQSVFNTGYGFLSSRMFWWDVYPAYSGGYDSALSCLPLKHTRNRKARSVTVWAWLCPGPKSIWQNWVWAHNDIRRAMLDQTMSQNNIPNRVCTVWSSFIGKQCIVTSHCPFNCFLQSGWILPSPGCLASSAYNWPSVLSVCAVLRLLLQTWMLPSWLAYSSFTPSLLFSLFLFSFSPIRASHYQTCNTMPFTSAFSYYQIRDTLPFRDWESI